ncbi:DUF6665 family protein [Mesorhizobium australicum]|jgi:hypothetical protein|uniref:Uncharacterized protein n=1 Tax=Mesorhizobium australicum TaxID=536018 RepID=A0A1X7PJW4_9HYPH|nr:DUF6665 family protein [Mesorhizobium australicum]SMH51211.1 hypothetical protein SAMN02982922_4348 [Mesorhizobium australicum]
MALRLPGRITVERASSATGLQPVEHEILGEMASSLGEAGRRAEQALAKLAEDEAGLEGEAREKRLRAVAAAVQAYFIQRELCGMRRHDDVIREMGIPKRILARLGAR